MGRKACHLSDDKSHTICKLHMSDGKFYPMGNFIIIIICDPVNRSQVRKYLVGTIYAGFC